MFTSTRILSTERELRRRRACLTLFFSFFLETRGISLDRDDFFAALGAYYSGHVPPEASLIEFSSEPRQPNLVFSEFFLVWGRRIFGRVFDFEGREFGKSLPLEKN